MKMRATLVLLSAGAALAVTAGCGGSSGSKPVVSAFSATPGSLPVGGGNVTFTWNVKNADALDIEPFVGVVTGTSATVALTTGGEFTLTATNSHGEATAATTVNVPPGVILHGKVIAVGAPLANSAVLALGQGAEPALTDTNGAFTLVGVVPPYDLAVRLPGIPITVVYRGLTRTDPTIDAGIFLPPPTYQASFAGTVASGTGFPEASGTQTLVSLHSREGVQAMGSADPSNGTWTFSNVGWMSRSSTDVHFHALEYTQDAAGYPATFQRFGNVTFAGVQNADSITGQDVPMNPVMASGTITGSIVEPAGYADPNVHARVNYAPGPMGGVFLPPGDGIDLPGFQDTSGGFSLHVPVIPNTGLDVIATAGGPTGTVEYTRRAVLPNATGVDLTLPHVSTALLPPPNAVVTSDTLFAWDANADAATCLLIFPNGGGEAVMLLQNGSSTTLPDLSEIGWELVPGNSYAWVTLEFGPFASVDDAAGAGGLFLPMGDSWNSFPFSSVPFVAGP